MILRHGNGIYLPLVEAKVTMPLPPFPDGQAVDVADGGQIEWMDLLTIKGPPAVVASALAAMDDHLEKLAPALGQLYDDHTPPQHGG